jgi:hypothetical protein
VIECGGRAKTNRPPLAVTNWLASWSLFRAGARSVGDVPLNSHASVGAKSGALLPPPKQAPSRDTSCEHNIDTVKSEEGDHRHSDRAMARHGRKGVALQVDIMQQQSNDLPARSTEGPQCIHAERNGYVRNPRCNKANSLRSPLLLALSHMHSRNIQDDLRCRRALVRNSKWHGLVINVCANTAAWRLSPPHA